MPYSFKHYLLCIDAQDLQLAAKVEIAHRKITVLSIKINTISAVFLFFDNFLTVSQEIYKNLLSFI